MNWRALGLALTLLCCGSPSATAEVFEYPISGAQLLEKTLAAPAAELAENTMLAGKFVQQRFLAGIPRPLVSQGDFLLARDHGVYWRTLTPFVSELALTGAGMVLRDEEAGVKHITPRQQPALRLAMEVFSAMFTLDVEKLQRHFVLFGFEENGRWQVGLRPKQPRLAAAFKEAVVSGSRYVERIELKATEGDRTEIELSEVVARKAELTTQEQQHFQ